MTRPRPATAAALSGAVLGILLAPGAALADGPGYGGTADALTVQWQSPSGGPGPGLGVYAVGFKAGSPVRLQVGSAGERSIAADPAGALSLVVADAAASNRVTPGTSVVAVGRTPAGALRTLIGSVPPPDAGTGLADVAPWAVAVALAGMVAAGVKAKGGVALAGMVAAGVKAKGGTAWAGFRAKGGTAVAGVPGAAAPGRTTARQAVGRHRQLPGRHRA